MIKFEYNTEKVKEETARNTEIGKNLVCDHDAFNDYTGTYYRLSPPETILQAALYKFYKRMSIAKTIVGSVFFYAGSKKKYNTCMGVINVLNGARGLTTEVKLKLWE